MAFAVRVIETAKAEIDTAYSWLRQRNSVYADKWFRELMDTIATLQEKLWLFIRQIILNLDFKITFCRTFS